MARACELWPTNPPAVGNWQPLACATALRGRRASWGCCDARAFHSGWLYGALLTMDDYKYRVFDRSSTSLQHERAQHMGCRRVQHTHANGTARLSRRRLQSFIQPRHLHVRFVTIEQHGQVQPQHLVTSGVDVSLRACRAHRCPHVRRRVIAGRC